MTNSNDFLTADQLQDYQESFKNSRFSPDDFELTQRRAQQAGIFYDPLAGQVIVRCKATGVEKVYELHSGTTWPNEFKEDLLHGIFA